MKRRYKIRDLVIAANLAVLVLLIAGIIPFRILDKLIYRQTEAKLAAEAAYIKAIYVRELVEKMEALGGSSILETDRACWPPPKSPVAPNASAGCVRAVANCLVPENIVAVPSQSAWMPYDLQIGRVVNDILDEPKDESGETKCPPNPAHLLAGASIIDLLDDAQLMTLSGVRVLDPNGVVIATNGRPEGIGYDYSGREEVREALAGQEGVRLRWATVKEETRSKTGAVVVKSHREARIYVAIPILYTKNANDFHQQERKAAGVKIKPKIVLDRLLGVVYMHRLGGRTFFNEMAMTMLGKRLWATLGVLLAMSFLLSLLLSYAVTQPLKHIAAQSERIAGGEDNVSLALSGMAPTEAVQLAASLDLMVGKLQKRMLYIQEFSRNVSHEFKTPLASTRGAIELLRDHWEEMSAPEREKFLAIIDDDAFRMDRLVRKLLELARIESGQKDEGETDLAELLPHIVHRYREAGAEIEYQNEDGEARAEISPAMAETLFVNLIDNAVVHGRGASVTVRLEPGPVVTVSDQGPGISAANLPRIFDRFFTTNRDKGGVGLGLSMVKAIAEAHGAAIEVMSRENRKGATFKVSLKPVGS